MHLTTERLLIRSFTKNDLDALFALLSDPEVMRYSLYGPLTYEKVERYLEEGIIQHEKETGVSLYAVETLNSHQLIGYTGFRWQTIDDQNLLELGYRLFPCFWGQGLATEAAAALAQYAFEVLGVNQLISIIEPQNTKSASVAKRLGMHFWKEAPFHHLTTHIWRLLSKDMLFMRK